MGAIADWVSRMVSFIPAIRLNNVLEILIISVLIYYILIWIRDTRAWTLLKGILVICAFMLFAYVFQMDTILWLFQNLISVAIISIFVLFQPELRRALEQLGRKNILSSFFNLSGSGAADEQTVKTVEKTKSEIIKACMEMSKVRTGALIVIEQDVQLSEYERTGIFLDSLVSSQLLINILNIIRRCMTALCLYAITVLWLQPVICLYQIICFSVKNWEPVTGPEWESVRCRTALR